VTRNSMNHNGPVDSSQSMTRYLAGALRPVGGNL